jgi:tRNA(Ser,Leu) C12 N-acetylase TAN1
LVLRERRLAGLLNRLRPLGRFRTSGYPRVLLGMVDDNGHDSAPGNGDRIARVVDFFEQNPELAAELQRVVPVEASPLFERDDVTETLCVAMHDKGVELAGRSFHVRAHLRGLKGRQETTAVEGALGEFLLERAEAGGRAATVTFSDPDVVIAVEVAGRRAGYAFFEREQRALPLLWKA